MTRGVIYMLLGRSHACMFAVSMRSLRKHWDGPVCVVHDEVAKPYVERVCKAAGGQNVLLPFVPAKHRQNTGYANKPTVPMLTPFDMSLQIDVDTIVVGPLEGAIWPSDDEWVLTQFSNWVSTGKIVSGRIRKWADVAPDEAAAKLKAPQPALNTGIMAYTRHTKMLPAWQEMVSRKPSIFMSDETAADLLTGDERYKGLFRVLDDRWNWSACFGVAQSDIRIVHVHGKRNVRDTRGRSVWFPRFMEAWRTNFAGLQEWCMEGDKHLKAYAERWPHWNTVGFNYRSHKHPKEK